jgi:hypothetical protein
LQNASIKFELADSDNSETWSSNEEVSYIVKTVLEGLTVKLMARFLRDMIRMSKILIVGDKNIQVMIHELE